MLTVFATPCAIRPTVDGEREDEDARTKRLWALCMECPHVVNRYASMAIPVIPHPRARGGKSGTAALDPCHEGTGRRIPRIVACRLASHSMRVRVATRMCHQIAYSTRYGIVTHMYNTAGDSIREMRTNQTIPWRMWIFWFGPRMRGARKAVYTHLVRNVGIPITLVDASNLHGYVLANHPLHRGFTFLSANHKADYLTCYFAHHYGGVFHDVKQADGEWAGALRYIGVRPRLWIAGTAIHSSGHVACFEDYATVDPECRALRRVRHENATHFAKVGHVGRAPAPLYDRRDGACCARMEANYKQLVGQCAFIVRPHTRFTHELLLMVHRRLDHKFDVLMQHPAPAPRCCLPHDVGGYPIVWPELKGGPMHALQIRYSSHVSIGHTPGWGRAEYRNGPTEDAGLSH